MRGQARQGHSAWIWISHITHLPFPSGDTRPACQAGPTAHQGPITLVRCAALPGGLPPSHGPGLCPKTHLTGSWYWHFYQSSSFYRSSPTDAPGDSLGQARLHNEPPRSWGAQWLCPPKGTQASQRPALYPQPRLRVPPPTTPAIVPAYALLGHPLAHQAHLEVEPPGGAHVQVVSHFIAMASGPATLDPDTVSVSLPPTTGLLSTAQPELRCRKEIWGSV